MLALVFFRGFQEAIGLASAVGIPYILLNAVVLGRGIAEIVQTPGTPVQLEPGHWQFTGTGPSLLLASAIIFPKARARNERIRDGRRRHATGFG